MKARILFACLIGSMMLISCDNGGYWTTGGGGSSSSGDAPFSIPSGKTLSGASLLIDFGSGYVSLTKAATIAGGYTGFSGTPYVSYSKTSSNSATLSWSTEVYTKSGGTKTLTGNMTLFFISPSEGYASGTENGSSVSDRHFTLL